MIDSATLTQFARLFVSRRDDYALQRETGRYVRVGAPVSAAALSRHLAGIETMGTYVIDEGGLCRFAVYDADRPDGLSMLAGVQARLAADGVPSYLECSRRGGHLWVLFSRRVQALLVRRWLLLYCPADVEFYPKQDEIGQGYGSLIRLPLGVHRLSGRRYPFVSWVAGSPVLVARSASALLIWFSSLERAAVPADSLLASLHTTEPASTHTPSITKSVAPAVTSEYASIAAWCAMQDPFTLIGRYITLDRRGLGHCPFGEHHSDGYDGHSSFRVYAPSVPGGCCWYCYTWGHGGNVFNFLSRYLRLDAKTLWSCILAGESF